MIAGLNQHNILSGALKFINDLIHEGKSSGQSSTKKEITLSVPPVSWVMPTPTRHTAQYGAPMSPCSVASRVPGYSSHVARTECSPQPPTTPQSGHGMRAEAGIVGCSSFSFYFVRQFIWVIAIFNKKNFREPARHAQWLSINLWNQKVIVQFNENKKEKSGIQ